MADETVMRLTPKQLALMTERVKTRERTRIAEELRGFAAFEQSAGHNEAAIALTTIADGLGGVGGAVEPAKLPLTAEQVRDAASRLLVPGMETLPFMGFDAADGDALPEAREHSDDEDISRMARRL